MNGKIGKNYVKKIMKALLKKKEGLVCGKKDFWL
jgi:hypothetical protein